MKPSVLIVALLLLASHAQAKTLTVSPSGGADFTTIAQAAAAAQSGDTVRIAAGTYREAVILQRSGTADAPITFEAAEPGKVVVDGADPLSNFERVPGEGPVWKVAWPHVFMIDRDAAGKPVEHHPDNEPLWGRAEQVLAGGDELRPAASLDELRKAWADKEKSLQMPVKNLNPNGGRPFAGAFFADTADHVLYLWLADGGDPAGRVEASTRDLLFGVNGFSGTKLEHIVARGLTFRHAANFPQRPAVWLPGANNLLEDCLIERTGGKGASVNGTVRRCLFRSNGHLGGGAEGDHFVDENSIWEGNSWKPIDRGWEAGGEKIAVSDGGRVEHCAFTKNGGPGLWFDIDVSNVTVSGCLFTANEDSGLFVEISRGITVQDNEFGLNGVGVVGTPGSHPDWSIAGIQVAESFDVTVTRNKLVGDKDGITIRQQGRRPVEVGGKTTEFFTHDVRITNNLILGAHGYPIALWYDNPFFGPHPTVKQTPAPRDLLDPAAANLTIDANAFTPGGGGKLFLYGAPWREKSREFTGIDAVRDALGYMKSGVVLPGVTTPPPAGVGPRDAAFDGKGTLGPAWMQDAFIRSFTRDLWNRLDAPPD